MVDETPEKSQMLISHILAVAGRHFAEKGFSGARMDEIALDAQVNKATIYYHLGNKETLYSEVFIKALEAVVVTVGDEVRQAPTLDEKIRAYVHALGDAFSRRMPHLSPMVMREVATGGSRMPPEALRCMGQVQGILRGIITEGQKQRCYRQVNPFIVHMMIIGSLEFLISGEGMRKRVQECLSHEFPEVKHVALAEAVHEISEVVLLSLKSNNP